MRSDRGGLLAHLGAESGREEAAEQARAKQGATDALGALPLEVSVGATAPCPPQPPRSFLWIPPALCSWGPQSPMGPAGLC